MAIISVIEASSSTGVANPVRSKIQANLDACLIHVRHVDGARFSDPGALHSLQTLVLDVQRKIAGYETFGVLLDPPVALTENGDLCFSVYPPPSL